MRRAARAAAGSHKPRLLVPLAVAARTVQATIKAQHKK